MVLFEFERDIKYYRLIVYLAYDAKRIMDLVSAYDCEFCSLSVCGVPRHGLDQATMSSSSDGTLHHHPELLGVS